MVQQLISEATTPAQLVGARRISWGAIFAGTMLAVVVEIMLGMLGMGIGLSTIDPLSEQNPAAGVGLGMAIWGAVSGIFAFFFGGWVAARLAGIPRRSESMLHGLLCWSTAAIFGMLFVTSAAGRLISGAAGMAGSAIGGVGQGIVSAAGTGGGDSGGISQELSSRMSQGGGAQAADLARKAQAYLSGGRTPAERQDLARSVSRTTGVSEQEANSMIQRWEGRFDQFRGQAGAKGRQFADTAAKTGSKAAFVGFIGLLIGAISAALGGAAGMPRGVIGVTR